MSAFGFLLRRLELADVTPCPTCPKAWRVTFDVGRDYRAAITLHCYPGDRYEQNTSVERSPSFERLSAADPASGQRVLGGVAVILRELRRGGGVS